MQWRYVVLHIEISKALKRKFDSSSGKEIEPNYGKDKKVSTGYLMSSYSKLVLHTFLFVHHKCMRMAVFILEDALSVWMNLGKHL